MSFVFTTSGLARWARLQWAPTRTAHDPNPPIPLETPPPAGFQAVRFDANADVLTMPAAALPSGSGGWTVAGWFRIVNDRNAVSAFWSLDGIFSSSWHSLRTTVDGTSLRLNESGTDVLTVGSLTPGVWYFVAVRKDASGNVKSYLGTEAGGSLTTATGTVTNIATYSGDGYVGGNAYGDWADSRIWGLRLWDADLSDAEVDAEFIASTAARTTNLRAQWKLESATTPGTDSSGNGRDLTNTGGAWALEAGPTLPSGGATVTGSISATLGNVTSAAAGATATGSIARTLADTTSAATGARGATGAVAQTLADVTSAASGTATGTTATGTIAVTLGDATSAASGSTATGSVAKTLADTTSAASGARGAAGSAARTLDNATSAGAGSTVAGSVARTLGDVTSVGSGARGAAGTIARTLENVTASGAGTFTNPATGSIAATLGNVTSSGTGSVPLNGSSSVTLQGVTSVGSGSAEPPTFTSPAGGLRRMRRNISVG